MHKRLNVVKVIVKMPKIDALDALGDLMTTILNIL